MASGKTPLPHSMIAPESGETLTRGTRPFTVTYKGDSVVVELPGYYPAHDGDGVLVGEDMLAADDALRALKQKYDDRHREVAAEPVGKRG